MLNNHNIIVIDTECLQSADDCRHCGLPQQYWDGQGEKACPDEHGHMAIGWNDRAALGLSIGAYYDYEDAIVHWFDVHTLEETMRELTDRQALLVSYNGISHDFPLMRGLLRQRAETADPHDASMLTTLCNAFKTLCAASYDILAEIWKIAPADKFTRGLNSLDAICQANGLGGKTGTGAQAPRDWQAGRIATVLNYCQRDVLLTKALFEQICRGEPIKRSDGSALMLPLPTQEENANG